MIDELAAAAERLRAAAARLRLTDLLGLFVPRRIAVWVIGILFGMLTSLMPVVIFVAGFLVILAGAWMFWRRGVVVLVRHAALKTVVRLTP